MNNFYEIYCFNVNLFASDCKKPTMPADKEWEKWLQKMKFEALEEGISKKTIDNELSNILPQRKIIMRDRCQPESTITFKEYLYYRIDKARIIATFINSEGCRLIPKIRIHLLAPKPNDPAISTETKSIKHNKKIV